SAARILTVAHVLLRNLRTIGAAALLIGIATAVGTFLMPREYLATVAFTPSEGSKNSLSAMSGVASQFGLQLDLGAGGQSIAFYTSLVKSRELQSRLAAARYVVR